MASRDPIVVDKPEEDFYFGGDFRLPNPVDNDGIIPDIVLIDTRQHVVGIFTGELPMPIPSNIPNESVRVCPRVWSKRRLDSMKDILRKFHWKVIESPFTSDPNFRQLSFFMI